MKLFRIAFICSFICFGLGCLSISVDEPTHFDIKTMIAYYTADTTDKYMKRWSPYSSGSKPPYLILDFRDSMYYFTANAANRFSWKGTQLYAAGHSKHQPSEEIEKILIIARSQIGQNIKFGDTINHLTDIDQSLIDVNYQAQEYFVVNFTQPVGSIEIQYFQTNGEFYIYGFWK